MRFLLRIADEHLKIEFIRRLTVTKGKAAGNDKYHGIFDRIHHLKLSIKKKRLKKYITLVINTSKKYIWEVIVGILISL